MKIEELKKAQEIANNISATIKSLKLYKEGHSIQEQMISRLFSFFKSFHSLNEILEFEIDGEGLKFEEKLLLSSKDVENDFIFNLFKDGVRYLAFKDGLEEEELKNFLNLITKSHPRDQDYSTLLWEESFPHIIFARIEALLSFFKKDEEKFLQEEVQNWINKIKAKEIFIPPDLKIKEEEGEEFKISEKEEFNIKPLEEEKENSLKELISNLLNSLKSNKKEILQISAKNLRVLANMIIEEANLKLIRDLISLLPENSEIKEVQELRNHLLSNSTLNLISSSIFLRGEPDNENFGLFLNILPDDKLIIFLLGVFKRRKDFLYPFYRGLSIFREDAFLNFLSNIPQEDGIDIINFLNNINDELSIKIFELKIISYQKVIIKKLEKPITQILLSGIKSSEKELRLISIEKILKFQLKEFLKYLIEEIEKEEFFKRDRDEKEMWFVSIAILGKGTLEDYFLSFFERKSIIFSFSSEEKKYLAAIALKILGTKKAIPVLKNEIKKIILPNPYKEILKKAIEEIERREK